MINCALCSDILREPRMLLCQHTFCHDCLVRVIRLSSTLSCPACRFVKSFDDWLSPEEKIKQIPINRYVQVYIENVSKKSERCLTHNSKEVIYYCSGQKTLVCSECILGNCKKCHDKTLIKPVEEILTLSKYKSDILEQKKDLNQTEETMIKIIKRVRGNMDQMETDRELIEQNLRSFKKRLSIL